MIKIAVLKLIRLYQNTLSPDTGFFSDKHPNGFCRFHPHCSEYGYQAVKKYGVLKGFFLFFKRFIRCNPFNKGGIDPLK